MNNIGKFSSEEKAKLRSLDFSKLQGFERADDMLDRECGREGSAERAEFDAKAKAWFYGEVLRERRKTLGFTQRALAELVGCKQNLISSVEKGETDMQLSSFIRIAEALGIKLRLDVSLA